MEVLVTGGLGYIGSHVSVSLLNKGYKVIIVDDLSNSSIDIIDRIKEITNNQVIFYNLDVCNYEKIKKVFETHNINTIMHFAGYKSVSESITKPLDYYRNNLNSTMNLLDLTKKYNVKQFIFSSSATVYGDGTAPYTEKSPLLTRTNSYGESKAMCERIISDYAYNFKDKSFIIFRYFNPVGAHPSGLIGEWTNNIPNNLMPFITKVALKELEVLDVFGNDYPTRDGTGVRDFIHVVDLAEGHIAAIEFGRKGLHVYNLGTGKGYSVLELIETFERVNNIRVDYRISARREGDIAESYADVSKAKEELNWYAKYTLKDMCKHSWKYIKQVMG